MREKKYNFARYLGKVESAKISEAENKFVQATGMALSTWWRYKTLEFGSRADVPAEVLLYFTTIFNEYLTIQIRVEDLYNYQVDKKFLKIKSIAPPVQGGKK